jgi:hypothetical protein
VVDDVPWCDACVDALSRDRQARAAMGGSFVLIAWGLLFYASRFRPIASDSGAVVLFGGITAMGLGLCIGWPRRRERTVREREPAERFEGVGPAQPYRARLRRVARAAVAPLSAKNTVLAVAISMLVAAVLVPVRLKLPHWLESELVLAAWWAVLAATLALLLYRGSGLVDDYHYRPPRILHSQSLAGSGAGEGSTPARGAARKSRRGKRIRGKAKRDKSGLSLLEMLNPLNWLEAGEAFVVVAVVAVALLAAFAVAWLLVEALLPLVFVAVYYLLRRALARAAADPRDCRRRPARSLFWGAVWSAIYVVPLGLLVWGVHAVLRWKHGG